MTDTLDRFGIVGKKDLAPRMSCAIGDVEIAGVDTAKLAQHLWDRRRIIVVPILHEEYQGLRVTPNV